MAAEEKTGVLDILLGAQTPDMRKILPEKQVAALYIIFSKSR